MLHTNLLLLLRDGLLNSDLLLLLLLLLLLNLKMRCANAHMLLQLKLMWVGTLNLCIVTVHKLLDCLEGSVAQLICCLWVNLLDLLKVIYSDVLVSIGLEDITSYFTTFKA